MWQHLIDGLEGVGEIDPSLYKEQHIPSPAELDPWYSYMFFGFTTPFIHLGGTKTLELEDMDALKWEDRPQVRASRFQEHWRQELINAQTNHREPSIIRAVFKTHTWFLIRNSLMNVVWVIARLLQIWAFKEIIIFVGDTSGELTTGLLLVALYVACGFTNLQMMHHHVYIYIISLSLSSCLSCLYIHHMHSILTSLYDYSPFIFSLQINLAVSLSL